MDKKGNLYGVTENGGGSANCNSGCGVVYKLSKSGKVTVLYSFTGGTTDGCVPVGTLTMGKAGNFYGTTNSCGSSDMGIVWKMRKGKETVLHNFAGGSSDGADPYAGVIMAGSQSEHPPPPRSVQ